MHVGVYMENFNDITGTSVLIYVQTGSVNPEIPVESGGGSGLLRDSRAYKSIHST